MLRVYNIQNSLHTFVWVLASWTCEVYSQDGPRTRVGREDSKQSLLAELLLVSNVFSGGSQSPETRMQRRIAMPRLHSDASLSSGALPPELREAEIKWVPELQVTTALRSQDSASKDQKVEKVLDWLQGRLIELGATDDDDISLWQDFIDFGRPWSNIRDAVEIKGDKLAEDLWQSAKAHDFLAPDGNGGTLLLLLPGIGLSLFDMIIKTLHLALTTHVNADLQVKSFHPGHGTLDKAGCPVPTILLFFDTGDKMMASE